MQLVADHQAAAAGRLDIAPVPVAALFGNRDERPMVGPVPVKAIAAKAKAHLVGLGPIGWLPAPDREQPQQQALVSDGVEIVELRRRLEVVARRIETVSPDPRQRLASLPFGSGDQIGMFPVMTNPSMRARVAAQAIDPDLTERVIEDGRPVAAGPAR